MLNLGRILGIMEKEGRKRNAPVFKFENKSRSAFQILIMTSLSSRTKDTKTIEAAGKLFKKIKNPGDLAGIGKNKLEKMIYGVGFYKTKAKNLKKLAGMLLKEYKGTVPRNLEDLLKLPGVGRKTANIVLARAFGKNTLGVDTHVHRISNRFGWTRSKTPEETERKLVGKIQKKLIGKLNRILVAYGQTVCTPVNPKCKECRLCKICPKIKVKDKFSPNLSCFEIR